MDTNEVLELGAPEMLELGAPESVEGTVRIQFSSTNSS
jgi:hypothetical protein